MTIKAYAVKEPKTELGNFKYEEKELGEYDVRLKITHCGVCHSDVHLIDNDWGITKYPFVPGHEIVGEVLELGKKVTHLKTGERVGVGWQKSACYTCQSCLEGFDTGCPNKEETCVHNHGGFAEAIVTDSRFAFKVPEKLLSENVAPLLCGGITVFTPLMKYVKPTMKVGVIGIGGLGHLALQFADAFGCEVVAFSHSKDKEKEAKKLGADNFVSSVDVAEMKKHRGSLDFILSTVHAKLDWNAYMGLLKPKGRLCIVGAVPEPIEIHSFNLIVGSRGIVGSSTGSRADIVKMLDFAARHDIKAMTEVFPMSDVNKAIQKLRENKIRYRAVLKN
ncbi:MAG: NAD(P)-dependent alcohol dehydrogenase [Nanoarchaeota archaeon]